MSRSFTLNQLTEGIRDRHVGQESRRLQEKWTRTGLLRGLQDYNRESMSRLLENQAAQVLREANTLGSGGNAGQIDGFSNIAFPIVRRVFGGLVANELVSIQPMSLPSGLLFYLDYTYGSDVGGDVDQSSSSTTSLSGTNNTYNQGDSLYGNPGGANIRTGANAAGGQYDLAGTSFTKVHGNHKLVQAAAVINGAFGGAATQSFTAAGQITTSGSDGKLLQFDPQITKLIDDGSNSYQFLLVSASLLADSQSRRFDSTHVKEIALVSATPTAISQDQTLTAQGATVQGGSGVLNVRRLNQLGTMSGALSAVTFTPDPFATVSADNAAVLMVVETSTAVALSGDSTALALTASFPVNDAVSAEGGTGGTLVIPSFESDFGSTPTPVIPEIDIKIESIAVTATTRKLRARWSPELAQDLNAYHSMDAEVELTQILSEQIALEIDREILNDLLVEARGANFYWSRSPGKFVNKQTGQAVALNSSLATGPQFTGTVREWYETLVETIIDVANEIHRKTLRGSANFIVVSPEVATIFEASVLYKPSIKIDGQGQTSAPFSIGAEAIGSLSNRFTVYKDPYFPRNKILVGYKGGSYLESGYVYAPYVPLIVTPTIFAPEDFTPRKGVMTRYGKKMVRADFYGTVTCLDMDII
jgi:hypothetical protein